MLLNKEELAVLDAFRKNINKTLSVADIQKISKKTSKPYVFNTLKKLERCGLIEKTLIGTSSAYKAKFSLGAIKYFSLLDLEEYEKSSIPKRTIENMIKNIKPLRMPLCIVLFGSHAKGTATSGSDVDVALLVKSETERKRLIPAMESVVLRELAPIHYEIITTDEFAEMLLSKEANLGKEIAHNHIILFGNELYYQLIEEAYSHGYIG